MLQTDVTSILRKIKDILGDLDQRITNVEEKSLNTANSSRYDISLLQDLINELEDELRAHE